MRRFVLPALLLAAAPLAHAQTTFGLTAGLNVANLSFDDDLGSETEKEARLGFVAGVFADVALTPQLSFHPEVLYSQKGAKLVIDVSEDGLDGQISQTVKIDYIEVPLLLAYRIPVGQNGLAVGIEAGPTLAYKLNTGTSTGCSGNPQFETLICDNIDDGDGDEIEDDAVRDVDFGVAGGVSVGAGPFAVGLRYTHGLTSIDDTENDVDRVEVRNRVVSVSARYSFGR